MYYLQSRYYNPELGRFISADDYAYISNVNSISLNAYCYCANNPIMHSDPTGKAWVSDVGIQVVQIIFTTIFVDGILTLINETSTIAYNMINNFIASNVDLSAKMAIAFTAMVSMFWNEYVIPFNDKVIDTLSDLLTEMIDWLYKTAIGSVNSIFDYIEDSLGTISDELYTDLQKDLIIIMNGLSVIMPLLFPETGFVVQSLIGTGIQVINTLMKALFLAYNGTPLI